MTNLLGLFALLTPRRCNNVVLVALLTAFCLLAEDVAGQVHTSESAEPRTLMVSTRGGEVLGMPIHWGPQNAVILQSDGAMQVLDHSSISGNELLSSPFRPDSRATSRVLLADKLGPRFDIMVSGPYVVAAPNGRVKRWTERFNELLAGYTRYFAVRNWSLRQPDFSLQIIVFPNRREFEQFAREQIGEIPTSAIGSYFPASNICCLYELPGLRTVDWSETEATIVHEAIHQLAHNTGIHQRLFASPLWYVEGLATMFEVQAVYASGRTGDTPASRIHPGQLAAFQPVLADVERLESVITQLVASDDLFRSDTKLAYAAAWGLTFYLSERMPGSYQQLARLQAARGIGEYSTRNRIDDFQSSVRTSPRLLATKVQRFYASLQYQP